MSIVGSVKGMYNERVEDFCVRLLYFFNTIDTYFLVAGLASYALVAALHRTVPNWTALAAVTIAVYALYKLADFYPLFLVASPAMIIPLVRASEIALPELGLLLAVNALLFVVVQFGFMGIPDSIVARDPMVSVRKVWNSGFTVAPTTVSLSMSVAFSTLYSCALAATPSPTKPAGAVFWGAGLAGALAAWRLRPRSFRSAPRMPTPSGPLAQRVVIVNIDGCRLDVLHELDPPFLRTLSRDGSHFPKGLETVYRALTNPAFASILTGTIPATHGIRDNNMGQTIRVEGLPDVVKTKLYGSMHVKHFSKKSWDTRIVSLPTHGVYKSDPIMFDWLREDLAGGGGTRLFIADISETDFLGHAYGSRSHQYREALLRADTRIGEFRNWLDEMGLAESTILIICSDHGIVAIDHSYLLFDAERYVPFYMSGPGIRRGTALNYRASIMDIAPTVCYLLGVRYPGACEGRVFEEAIETR